MPIEGVAAVAAEMTSAVAKAAAQTTPAVASAAESAASAGAAGAETVAESAVSATQEASAAAAGQANTGLAASLEQTSGAVGTDAGINELAWGKSEPPGTTRAKVDSNQPVEPTAPDIAPGSTPKPTTEASEAAEPTTSGEDAGTAEDVGPEPTDPTAPIAEPAAAEQTDTAGLKPGDRSYDAIIAEGDAKRAYEAAKADPATSPEDLARLEKEYTNATGEREQAVADRDKATIDARTEQIKREVTDSVKQEFQGQIDKLSSSNAEPRQAIQDMGNELTLLI